MSIRTHPWAGFRTLQGKLLVLVCSITVISTLVLSWLNQTQTYQVARAATAERLASDADLIAASLAEAIRNMRDDAYIIAETPPVQGLVRTLANSGIDPLDGSTDDIWRQRLATIFGSMMQARPEYMQLRYIGVADDGRELVRVNQVNGQSFPVHGDRLQQKAGEAYFQAALGLPADTAYLSAVTLNREFGEVDPRSIPTVRLLLPIERPDGVLFGFIAINADYELLIRQALAEAPFDDNVLVSNDNGDFFHARGRQQETRFAYHEDVHTYVAHPLLERALLASNGEIGEALGRIFATTRLNLVDFESPLDLRVTVIRDAAQVNAAALASLPVIIVVSLALVLVSLIITAGVINRVMRPFRALANTVETAASADQIRDLPVERSDEVGSLARALTAVTSGLIAGEARMRAIIESVVDGLIVVDSDGIIERVNPACEHIFGYSESALLGKPIRLLVPEEFPVNRSPGLGVFRGSQDRSQLRTSHELLGRRQDGSMFPIDLSLGEIVLPDQRLYCAIIRDITDRKLMDTMKDEFISTVNHEIRTPLTSLMGSLNLLRIKAAGRLDEKGAHLLELANQSSERLNALVNDILDLEKMAAGKLEYDMAPTEVVSLVEDVVAQHIALEHKHNIQFVLQTETAPVEVVLDPNRFHQALGNLLSNAAKFSPKGGEVTVRVAVPDADRSIVAITVSDQGPGIPEDFRDKVFERFSQADGSTTRAEGSSGLGLNITKTLIEAFDGQVEYDTVVGAGTSFHFHLPVHRTTSDATNAETPGANSLP